MKRLHWCGFWAVVTQFRSGLANVYGWWLTLDYLLPLHLLLWRGVLRLWDTLSLSHIGVVPLSIRVSPAVVIVVKHSWSKLWVHWWLLHILLVIETAWAFLSSSLQILHSLTLSWTRWSFLILVVLNKKFPLHPGPLHLLLVIVEHHVSLLL